MHVENGGHVLGWRQALPRLDFPVCDVAPDLGGDLLVQMEGVVSV